MQINRTNYEVFFLDYIEGRLSRAQEKELHAFLAAHADLAAELDGYEPAYLDKEEIIFGDKPGIKKKDDELTPVMQLIALMEGDLSLKESAELKKKIESDEYLRTQSELLQKTKLAPELSIRFPGKNKLKHRSRVIYLWRYAAVAACLIIGLTIAFRNLPDKTQPENIAQKNILPAPAVNTGAENVVAAKKEESLADNKQAAIPTETKRKQVHPEERASEKAPKEIVPAPALVLNEISTPAAHEPLPTEPVTPEENITPVPTSENPFTLNDIFTEEELKELQNMSQAAEPSSVKQLAKSGLNRLGQITGVQVQLPGREKQQDVFAFSVGNFEVRHVTAK